MFVLKPKVIVESAVLELSREQLEALAGCKAPLDRLSGAEALAPVRELVGCVAALVGTPAPVAPVEEAGPAAPAGNGKRPLNAAQLAARRKGLEAARAAKAARKVAAEEGAAVPPPEGAA